MKVQDSFGNGIVGQSVTFTVAAGAGSVIGSPATTNAAGQAAVGSWTLGSAPGLNQLTASSGALTPVTFSATATAGAAANLVKFAGDAQTTAVNGTLGGPVQVRVTDAGGNPVSGVAVTFGSVTGGGAITGATPVTNAGGIATLGSWTLGTIAGANSVTANAAGLTPVTFTATGTPGAVAALTKVVGDGQSAVVNATVAVSPQVQVTDAFGNGVSGVTITFAVTLGGGSITGPTPATSAGGFASVGSWTLGSIAGANALSASAVGLTTVNFAATGTPGSPASLLIVSNANQVGTVGTAAPSAPAVKVLDAFANGVPGVTVTFAIASGGGSLTGNPVVTNASGVAQLVAWNLGSVAGLNTATASAPGVGTPAVFQATAQAGAPVSLTNLAGDGVTVIVGQTVLPPPQLLVLDAFTNPVPGVSVIFSIVTGGGAITGGNAITNAAGQATVGSWTIGAVGSNVLAAQVGGLTNNFTVTGVAGSQPQLQIISGNGQFAKWTILPYPVVIRALNALGAPVVGLGIAAVVAGPSGGSIGAVAGGFVTDAAGTVSFNRFRLGTSPGNNYLAVSAPGYNGVSVHAVGVGLPTMLAKLSGDSQVVAAGSSLPQPMVVQVFDTQFQPVPGEVVTFTIVRPDPLNPLGVGTHLVLTDSGGRASFAPALDTMPGVTRVTASVRGTLPVPFIATGAALPSALTAHSIRLIRGSPAYGTLGSPFASAIQFLVLDSLGRPVTGQQVDFQSQAPEDNLPRPRGSVVTGADGIATLAPFTLDGDTPGAYDITASPHLSSLFAHAVVFAAGAAAQIEVVDGDNQTAVAGTVLPVPVTVRVVDAQGNLIPGISVAWTTTAPGPTPGSTVTTGIGHSTTNALGIATISWHLGPDVGQNKMVLGAGGATLTIFATGNP